MAYPTKNAVGANIYWINPKTGNNTRTGLSALLAKASTTGITFTATSLTAYICGETGFVINENNTTSVTWNIIGEEKFTISGASYMIYDTNGTVNFTNLKIKNYTQFTVNGECKYNLILTFTNCDIELVSFIRTARYFTMTFTNCLYNKSKRDTNASTTAIFTGCTIVNGTAAGEEILIYDNAANKNNIYYNQRILLGAATPTAAKNLFFDPNCTWSIQGVSGGAYIAYADKTALQTAWTASTLTGTKTIPATWQVGAIAPVNATIYDFSPTNILCATASDTSSYVGCFAYKRETVKVLAVSNNIANSFDTTTQTALTITDNSALLTTSTVNGEVYSNLIGNGVLRRIKIFDQFLQQGVKEYVTSKNQVGASVLFASLVNTNDYKVSTANRILTAATLTTGATVNLQLYVVLASGGSTNFSNCYTVATNGSKLGSIFVANGNTPTTWTGGTLGLMSEYTANSIYRNATGDTQRLGEVMAVTLGAGGTGYAANDVLYITDLASDGLATIKVLTVSGGVVQTISLVNYCGTGYTVGNGKATTNSVGTGINCTINVTTVRTAPIYNLVTEARLSIGMRWRATNLTTVTEISAGTTLNISSCYLVTSGTIIYNSITQVVGSSFTVLSGLPRIFTGTGKVKEVFTVSDTFYDFALSDAIQCTTTDNAALTITKSNMYLTTGDPLYFVDILAGTKSGKSIYYTYYQLYAKILQAQI